MTTPPRIIRCRPTSVTRRFLVHPLAACGFTTVLLVLASGPISVAAETPDVLVEARPTQVFVGESFRYSVTLNHCEASDTPILAEVADCSFRQASMFMVRHSTFNGVDRTTIHGPCYEYVATPSRAGTLNIPGPRVVVGGQEYQGKGINVRVLPPSNQDTVRLEVTASRTIVYPTQSFTLRLRVGVKGLAPPNETEDPLQATQGVPILVVPWADDDSLPGGVSPESPAARWLEPYLLRSRRERGYGLNNLRLGGSGTLSLFMEEQRAQFRSQPRVEKQVDDQGRTYDYWLDDFSRTFHASELGTLSFAPVSLKGVFGAGSRGSTAGEGVGERIFATTKPLQIEVREPPLAGRPASYSGLIGRVDLAAELAPTEVKVGDPLTFKIRLRGSGSVKNASAPAIGRIPEVDRAFKVYDATETGTGEEREFTYRVRPRQAGSQQFPAIEISYFDVEQERYVAVLTPPFPLEVARANAMDQREIAVNAPPPANNNPGIENPATNRAEAIRSTNDPSVNSMRGVPAGAPNGLLFATAMGIAVVGIAVSMMIRRRRRVRAGHRAVSFTPQQLATLLDAARQRAAAEDRRGTAESLNAALFGLLRAASPQPPSDGLTSQEVVDHLARLECSTETVAALRRVWQQLDGARFGWTEQDLPSLVADAARGCESLAAELRRKGNWR